MKEENLYLYNFEGIREAYQKRESWGDVVRSDFFNSDESVSMQAFVDYVEEVYKTKVEDATHLYKLTGITEEILRTEPNIEEGEVATLESIITYSNYSRYFTALETAIEKGAKYGELLHIEPQHYGLPETWEGCLASDKQSSILWALSFGFSICEPVGLMKLPDLRAIAKEVEAPYAVIMDAYKLTR